MLFYILLGVGLVLVIEGVAWAAAPSFMQRMLKDIIASPAGALRLAGLFAAALGVALVALARNFM